MRLARTVPPVALSFLVALVLTACSAGANPGWTFAPPPTPTVAPSASAGASSAASVAPSPNSSAPPSGGGTGGAVLQEVASGFQFQTASLSAAANQPFQIAFDNQDASTPHNIQIADGAGKQIFEGETVNGVAKTTYDVPALAAGTYKFSCKWHPNMVGELTVQ